MAYRFYYRLGFEPAASNGRHILMEWFHPDYDALRRGQFIPPAVAVKRMLDSRQAEGAEAAADKRKSQNVIIL